MHQPVLYILRAHLHARYTVLTGLMLIITVVLAAASYRYFEMPFLRLKKRFSTVASPEHYRRPALGMTPVHDE